MTREQEKELMDMMKKFEKMENRLEKLESFYSGLANIMKFIIEHIPGLNKIPKIQKWLNENRGEERETNTFVQKLSNEANPAKHIQSSGNQPNKK